MSLLIVRIRSLDVSGIAEGDGSFVTVHFRNVCLGEAVHPRFTGLSAREARLATPYGQDRHGLHYASAPLRPHQTCRKRGKASP